jgi:tetratricopeptide (TPR) repeat protein
MVGLVSPEMISGIGRYDRLLEFLTKQGTTHLAVLRNWFDVSDQNPLFLTDEQYPEIMEVFAFEPSRTHFAPADDQRLENVATYYLSRGNPQAVAQGLTQYFKTSPGTARLHALAGGAFLSLGNRDQAAREFEVSAERCPGYLDAQLGLSEIDRQRGNIAGAVSRLESVLQAVPTYSAGCRELSAIYGSTLADSTRAREVLDRCQRALQPLPSANEGRGE